MDGWTIALLGTNTFVNPDSSSLVTLAALNTTDPMTDSNWLKVDISGASPKKEAFNSPKERIGGISVHSNAYKQIYQLKPFPFDFPLGMPKLDKLNEVLLYRYIYFFKGTYDFQDPDPNKSWMIHPDSKAIMVSAVGKTEDDYDTGQKTITIDLQKYNPVTL